MYNLKHGNVKGWQLKRWAMRGLTLGLLGASPDSAGAEAAHAAAGVDGRRGGTRGPRRWLGRRIGSKERMANPGPPPTEPTPPQP